MRTAAPKDRKYLESLNLKALQKTREQGDTPAKDFYQQLQQEAASGPLFDVVALNTIEKLPELSKPVTKWLVSMEGGIGDVSAAQLRAVVEWADGDPGAATELPSLTLDQAVAAAEYWKQHPPQKGKYTTHHKVMDVGGGYSIVEIVDKPDLITEGQLMQNCLKDGSHWSQVQSGKYHLYSLRDKNNEPHASILVKGHDTVEQCYGKQNAKPIEKYNPYLLKFFGRERLYGAITFLQNPQVSDDWWMELAKSEYTEDNEIVIKSKSAPLAAVDLIARTTTSSYSLSEIAQRATKRSTFEALLDNPETRQDTVIGMLVNDYFPSALCLRILDTYREYYQVVRAVMHRNGPLPAAAFTAVLSGPLSNDPRILRYLVKHQNVTADILRSLAAHDQSEVLLSVARHAGTPSDVLEQLSTHEDADVRIAVALNPNTPTDVLERLHEDDPDEDVSDAAEKKLRHRPG